MYLFLHNAHAPVNGLAGERWAKSSLTERRGGIQYNKLLPLHLTHYFKAQRPIRHVACNCLTYKSREIMNLPPFSAIVLINSLYRSPSKYWSMSSPGDHLDSKSLQIPSFSNSLPCLCITRSLSYYKLTCRPLPSIVTHCISARRRLIHKNSVHFFPTVEYGKITLKG